jgi:hypothetical protein
LVFACRHNYFYTGYHYIINCTFKSGFVGFVG